jgi:hypothetical protein
VAERAGVVITSPGTRFADSVADSFADWFADSFVDSADPDRRPTLGATDAPGPLLGPAPVSRDSSPSVVEVITGCTFFDSQLFVSLSRHAERLTTTVSFGGHRMDAWVIRHAHPDDER